MKINGARDYLAGIALFAIGGCTVYHAQPLDQEPKLLSPPEASVLRRDSSTIDRPYLRPIDIDLGQPLDANAVAVLAVLDNPTLKDLRLRADVAAAQVFSARLLPDPSFHFQRDFRLPGSPDPLDNIAGGLAFDLKSLIQRSTLIAQARAREHQIRMDLAWAEWQTAGSARLDVVQILALQRISNFDTASRDSTKRVLDATLRASGRGDLSADLLQTSLTAAYDASERQRTSERDLNAAQFALSKQLGLAPGTPLQLREDPLPEGALDAADLYTKAREQRFDLQALRAGYDSEEAAMRKAVLDQFPRLDLTLNGARDTTNNHLLGPAVDMTLPLWNRNKGGIAIERATRTALKAEYETRLFETRADIAATVAGIAVARRQREAILAQLPTFEHFVEGSQKAADRGDISAVTAAGMAQALRDKKTQLVRSEQSIREQWIALELLTGAPLGEMLR